MQKLKVLLVILSIFLFSCSIDYGNADLPDKLLDSIPDNILYNFIYTESENGHKNFSLFAERAEIFEEKQQTFLYNITFQQYDESNEVISEGTADRGVIFTSNDNAEISGNVSIYSSKEETELETSYLFWNNDTKILEGKPEAKIIIIRDSGTVISGRGFSGDTKTKTYHLKSNVTGEYVYEEK